MITFIFLTSTLMMSLLSIPQSKNPMKTSMFLLISTMLIFIMMKLKMGSVWLPLIFFILFTGGILLMFMILSSILPNEKSMKIKIPKFSMLILLIILSWFLSKMDMKESTYELMKSFMSSNFNLIFMTTVILFYFFSSMSINNVEDYSMRSIQCWKKMIL